MSQDYIVRATAAQQQLRVFAITSRDLVEQGRKIHNTSPVATAALGRLLTAGAMMGSMMKGKKDLFHFLVRKRNMVAYCLLERIGRFLFQVHLDSSCTRAVTCEGAKSREASPLSAVAYQRFWTNLGQPW